MKTLIITYLKLFFLFLFFSSNGVLADNNKVVDSLNNVIENSSDTIKADAYIKLAKYYYFENEYYETIKNVKQAINLTPNDLIRLAKANNFLGLIYYHIGDYSTALNHHLKSLKYREDLDDEKLLSVAYNSIAVVYTALVNPKKSNYYLQKALIIEQKYNNTENIAMIYNNLSNNYSLQNKHNKALEYLLKSEKIIDDTNLDKALLLINIGTEYRVLNKLDKAKEYLFTAIDYCKRTQNDYYLAIAYEQIGRLFLMLKDYKQSLFFYNNSMQVSKKINAYSSLKNSYEGLTSLYAIYNNVDSILKYNELFFAINDSIFNKQTADKVAEMQIRYEFEKKEKEIDQLRIEKELADKKQKITVASFILILLILVIVFLLVIYKKRKEYSDKIAVKQNIKIIKYEDVIDNSNTETQKIDSPKDKNSVLSEEFKTMLEVSISKQIRKDKLFLKNDFSLNELAKILNTNRRYVSQVINERFDQNFSSFINEFRVKEAMRLMSNPEYKKFTIESISKKVGFNSISAFIGAFKKVTGLTPSTFMKTIK